MQHFTASPHSALPETMTSGKLPITPLRSSPPSPGPFPHHSRNTWQRRAVVKSKNVAKHHPDAVTPKSAKLRDRGILKMRNKRNFLSIFFIGITISPKKGFCLSEKPNWQPWQPTGFEWVARPNIGFSVISDSHLRRILIFNHLQRILTEKRPVWITKGKNCIL